MSSKSGRSCGSLDTVDADLLGDRCDEDPSANVITTEGHLVKLHYQWKPMYFPFRRYLLWSKEPMASQSKVFYSDDHRYALRFQLDWVSKRFELVVLQEPSPSLYKLKVCFEYTDDRRIEKTTYSVPSKAWFPWVPQEYIDTTMLNISCYVTIMIGAVKPDIDPIVSEHLKMIMDGMRRLFDLSSNNAFGACCDFTFKAEDKLLMVHKTIMGIMSPKLSAIMFERNSQEVEGVTFEGLSAFVRCVYTGRYKVDRQLIPDVMVLSRRYQLNRIALHFRDELIKECLRMCIKLGYRSNSLIHTFHKFRQSIFQSQHWKEFSQKHPECAAYILQDVFLID